MTAKRYYLGNGELYTICDSSKGGSDFFNMLTQFEVVDLLNELAEENQYLKSLKWNQDCINEISISIQQRQLLEEENEQLKKEILWWKYRCGEDISGDVE